MTASVHRRLSRREREVMDALFRNGEGTVAEVIEGMPSPPSYSAVRATLRTLEEKGHVRHREDGPRYVYLPTVAPEHARTDALRHMVRTFFGGSLERAVTALIAMSDADISDAEVDRLRERIRASESQGR